MTQNSPRPLTLQTHVGQLPDTNFTDTAQLAPWSQGSRSSCGPTLNISSSLAPQLQEENDSLATTPLGIRKQVSQQMFSSCLLDIYPNKKEKVNQETKLR